MPDAARFGLETAVSVARFDLKLLSYGDIPNAPKGVSMVDADRFLPKAEFEVLIGRVPVAMLADFVRVCAMSKSNRDHRVHFVDCDTVWLQNMQTFEWPPGYIDVSAACVCFAMLFRSSGRRKRLRVYGFSLVSLVHKCLASCCNLFD